MRQQADGTSGCKGGESSRMPAAPKRRGAHQQPMKNPTKWADPKRPICAVVKFSSNPDSASSDPSPPEESCSKITDNKRAVSDNKMRVLFST
jgi:hypothetical protein